MNELVIINYKYLHLCALHPNLQVIKLVIVMDEKTNQDLLDTAQDDLLLVALLRIPTFEKFAIAAFWDHYDSGSKGLGWCKVLGINPAYLL